MTTTSSPAAVPDARLSVDIGPRGFAAMHRDTWRTVARLPLIVLVLPAIIWFPFDLLAELVSSASGDDPLAQLRTYNHISRITGFLIGGFINALVLVGVFALGAGESTKLGDLFGEAKRVYQDVLITTWSIGWRVGLATLLLVVPGIVLAVRYALALPIAVRERKSGRDAVAASEIYTEGHRWRIFGYVTAAFFIYALLAMVPVMLLPVYEPVWSAVSTIPFNLLSTLLTVAAALLYAEVTSDRTSAPPVGRVPREHVLSAEPERSSGVAGVAVVTGLAVVLFVLSVVFGANMNELDSDEPPYDDLPYDEAALFE